MKQEAYEVTPVEGREWRQIIVPRRPRNVPLPLLTAEEAHAVQSELFTTWGEGLEAFKDSVTCEIPKRPIPHAFPASEVSALTELFKRWLPRIVALIKPQLAPPFQTYNPMSRLGAPYYTVVDKSTRQQIIRQYVDELLSAGSRVFERYANDKITAGVRLQTEPPDKERNFQFVHLAGNEASIYEEVVSPAKFRIETDAGILFPSRTRLIFLLSPWNLVRQVLDTAWHKVLLSYPVFRHNMYDAGARIPAEFRYAFAFDVKHFERHNAPCAHARAVAIGGAYGAMTEMFKQQRFLVPSDDWTRSLLLRVRREHGFVEQYTSGSSEVAPLQKDIFLALYAEFFVQTFNETEEQALQTVLSGGDARLWIKNYGDDNIVFSTEPTVFDKLMKFMSAYITVEPEVPLKFLGMLYLEDERRFVLPLKSYAVKTYVPERGVNTIFRKMPATGWVAKRAIYAALGERKIGEFFALEDSLLTRLTGRDWTDIVDESVRERLRARTESRDLNGPYFTDARVVTERDWLLGDKERYDSGQYVGFPPAETAPILAKLLNG